jgi:trans-aconitate methyltransferase
MHRPATLSLIDVPDSPDRIRQLAATLSPFYEGRFLRSYVYWKIRTDPLYPAVSQALIGGKDQPLVDLGCGAGLFPFYLKENRHSGSIRGLDIDSKKIEIACGIASKHWPDIQFQTSDFAAWDPSNHQGHVTLLDVLQYLPEDLQQDLLKRAATCLTSSTHRLIIRNGLADHSWRSRVTKTTDRMAGWIRWMPGSPLTHPTRSHLETPLRNAGLEISFTPLWGATPFNNYLIVARRPA